MPIPEKAVEKFLSQLEKRSQRATQNQNYKLESELLYIAVDFYELTIECSSFRSSRHNAKSLIERINPSFAKGYFTKDMKKA